MKTHTPIRDKVVASRTCVVCEQPYTPRWVEQQTCHRRCAGVLAGRPRRGQIPVGFATRIQQRRQIQRAAIEAACHARWPNLTAREREIFGFARSLGYNEGYGKGLQSQRRQKASAA